MQEQIYTVVQSASHPKPYWTNQRVQSRQVRTDHLFKPDTMAQQLINSRAQYTSLQQASILSKLGLNKECLKATEATTALPKSRMKFKQREAQFEKEAEAIKANWQID